MPLLSSSLVYLSMPPYSLSYLVFVAFIPLIAVLETKRYAPLSSLIFGITSWLLVTNWFYEGLIKIGKLNGIEASALLLLQSFIGGIPYLLFGVLIRYFKFINFQTQFFLPSLILTILVTSFPNTFPGNPANALFRNQTLIQIVDLGGVPLLFFLIFSVNILLFQSLTLLINRKGVLSVKFVYALLILLSLYCYGSYSLLRWEKAKANLEHFRIALIQPNIGIDQDERTGLDRLIFLTKETIQKNPGVQLVVWPEIPISFSIVNQPDDYYKVSMLINETKVPLFLSAFTFDTAKPEEETRFYNTAHLITGDIDKSQIYHKNKLIPFGEYIPLGHIEFIRNTFPEVRQYTQGTEIEIFNLGNAKIAPAICLETIYSTLISKFYNAGANIIINPSDDAYFGDSAGSLVHLALATFRAVEYRTPLVRVNNSGVTEVIDASGKFYIDDTKLFQERSWVVDVPIQTTRK